MTSFIQDLGHVSVILRSDGEPAIVTMLEALRDRGGQLESVEEEVIQAAPAHSHPCVGTGERSIQTIRAQMRTLVVQLQRKVGMELTADSPILPWAVRHAAWLYNRFHKRQDTNFTPFEQVHLKEYNKPLWMFGASCKCSRPGAQLNKFDIIHRLNGVWHGARLENRRTFHWYRGLHRASNGDTTNGGGTAMGT